MTSVIRKSLPFFASGIVVKGFGRGSKELGIPTANFPSEVVDHLPKDIECGIYYGWARVNNGPVYKMVMSIGWNPFYHNIKKSMETHIINQFPEDFYGSILRVAILGYLRPERDFSSLEELKSAITDDIREAERLLDQPHYLTYRDHSFFYSKNGTTFPPQNNGYSL
ncbi:riboflavin kinase [Centruroides vittatus]|uniref:riboflavin kinase n=1 Tax=Centruroides vittatus TaxID=120091 RepID=UPI00350EA912